MGLRVEPNFLWFQRNYKCDFPRASSTQDCEILFCASSFNNFWKPLSKMVRAILRVPTGVCRKPPLCLVVIYWVFIYLNFWNEKNIKPAFPFLHQANFSYEFFFVSAWQEDLSADHLESLFQELGRRYKLKILVPGGEPAHCLSGVFRLSIDKEILFQHWLASFLSERLLASKHKEDNLLAGIQRISAPHEIVLTNIFPRTQLWLPTPPMQLISDPNFIPFIYPRYIIRVILSPPS